ncbi:MAG: MotA/TolQ/ExbB proton channel family protein [Myxococcota bacterium]
METIQSLAKFYQEGGPWMHPITLVSIIALAVLVERFIALYLRYNINGQSFMAQIQKLIATNNIPRAIKICDAAPKAALPKVIKAGLTRANKDETDIIDSIEETTLEVMPLITKRTQSLAALGSTATMLGLLGTINGLIDAFASLENAAPDQKQAFLAKAISVALNTTAFGLMVGIPCTVGHVILTGITKKIVDEIDEYSLKLQNTLISRIKSSADVIDRTQQSEG